MYKPSGGTKVWQKGKKTYSLGVGNYKEWKNLLVVGKLPRNRDNFTDRKIRDSVDQQQCWCRGFHVVWGTENELSHHEREKEG